MSKTMYGMIMNLNNYMIKTVMYDRLLELYSYNGISFTDGIDQLVYFGYIESIRSQIKYRILLDDMEMV